MEAALATGWFKRNSFCKIFPLSDHAGFNQLIRYVKESNPRLVLTHHGFAREFAATIKRKLGINARALEKFSQTSLAEFI